MIDLINDQSFTKSEKVRKEKRKDNQSGPKKKKTKFLEFSNITFDGKIDWFWQFLKSKPKFIASRSICEDSIFTILFLICEINLQSISKVFYSDHWLLLYTTQLRVGKKFRAQNSDYQYCLLLEEKLKSFGFDLNFHRWLTP